MNLRVLGCCGAELPGCNPPGFLIDDCLLLDAGTIGAALTEKEQRGIRRIFITHCHLDHVRGIPFFADNLVLIGAPGTVEIVSSREILACLKMHVMNDAVWPDFARIPSPEAPVIRYRELESGEDLKEDGYTVTACSVSHSVPAQGYLVRKEGRGVLYTGDTGPTEAIWSLAVDLDALIVEVSFPNDMEEMAILTGHLTAGLLKAELNKLPHTPRRILVTHPKPQFQGSIEKELAALGLPHLELLADGARFRL